jgi:hypothetical protein
MNRIMTILGLLFLMGCSVIVWTNYVNPCPPPSVIFVDTCRVDSTMIDSTKCQTDN